MKNQIHKMLSQIQATRTKIVAMELGANGWKADDMNGEILMEPMTHLYFWDRPTNWVFMCSVPSSAFASFSLQASKFKDGEINAARYGVSSAINALAGGAELKDIDGMDTKTQLAIAATAYMGTTKVWQAADQMKSRESAIILNYRSHKNADEGLLRPVVSPTSEIIPVGELMQAISSIVHQDRVRHPEWFLTSKSMRP